MLRRPLTRSALILYGRSLHASLTAVPKPGGQRLMTSLKGATYGVGDINELQKVVDQALSRESIARERESLLAVLAQLKKELEPLEAMEADIERRATAHAARVVTCIGGALAVQFAVLFNWVFVVFDWNLVEPVTYFLGYTVIWWSLVFYNKTGRDFSYEGIIEELKERKRSKLLLQEHIKDFKLTEIRYCISTIEAKLRTLD